MQELKEKIYKLYRLTARLNLYMSMGAVEGERIKNELNRVKELID